MNLKCDISVTVYEYKVTIFTSDDSKSGTDSNVFIQIFGECGDTGYRKLMSSKTNTNKLEQGNVSAIFCIYSSACM